MLEGLIKDEMEIFYAKGTEYTIGNAEEGDALFNFKEVANLLDLKPTQVAAVYWLKHVFSILNYIKQGQTFSDESIKGRINDARNYLGFIMALIIEEELELDDPTAKSPGIDFVEELVSIRKDHDIDADGIAEFFNLDKLNNCSTDELEYMRGKISHEIVRRM